MSVNVIAVGATIVAILNLLISATIFFCHRFNMFTTTQNNESLWKGCIPIILSVLYIVIGVDFSDDDDIHAIIDLTWTRRLEMIVLIFCFQFIIHALLDLHVAILLNIKTKKDIPELRGSPILEQMAVMTLGMSFLLLIIESSRISTFGNFLVAAYCALFGITIICVGGITKYIWSHDKKAQKYIDRDKSRKVPLLCWMIVSVCSVTYFIMYTIEIIQVPSVDPHTINYIPWWTRLRLVFGAIMIILPNVLSIQKIQLTIKEKRAKAFLDHDSSTDISLDKSSGLASETMTNDISESNPTKRQHTRRNRKQQHGTVVPFNLPTQLNLQTQVQPDVQRQQRQQFQPLQSVQSQSQSTVYQPPITTTPLSYEHSGFKTVPLFMNEPKQREDKNVEKQEPSLYNNNDESGNSLTSTIDIDDNQNQQNEIDLDAIVFS